MREPSATPQMLSSLSDMTSRLVRIGLHGIDSPEDQGEASDSNEEGAGLLVLLLDNTTSINSKLVDDNQVGKAGHSIPAPLGALRHGKSSEEASQNHDDVSDDRNENVGAS